MLYYLGRDTTSETMDPGPFFYIDHNLVYLLFTKFSLLVRFYLYCFQPYLPHYMFNPVYSARREDWQPSCIVGDKEVLCLCVGLLQTSLKHCTPTGSITLVSQLRETCCCSTSYLPLGVRTNIV